MATLTIDPYKGTPGEFNESMWLEAVATFKPSGEDIFNKRSGEASLVGYIPNAVIQGAARYMLGYDQNVIQYGSPGTGNTGNVYFLARKNPVFHPLYSRLVCSGVSISEYKPDSRTRATIKKQTLPGNSNTPQPLQHRTGYVNAKVTLRFSPTSLTYVDDQFSATDFNLAVSRHEWLRNTSYDFEPRVETFETNIQYYFAEGTGCPTSTSIPSGPYTNPLNNTAKASSAQILVKPDVKIRWESVPGDYVIPNDGVSAQLPKNILAALGTVNNAFFLNYPPGTLLFLGAKMDRHPWTLYPDFTSTLPAQNSESLFLYDIELLFGYFNPTKGFTGNPPVQISTFTGSTPPPNLGWNNSPYAGVQAVGGAVDPNGGKWFLMTLNGGAADMSTTGSNTLFRYSNFAKIFDNPQNGP